MIRFFQREGCLGLKILALDGNAPPSPPLAATLSKQHLKEIVNANVARLRLELMCTRSVCLSAACVLRPIKSSRLRSGFLVVLPLRAKLIVLFSFRRIAKDFVCLANDLEPFLGRLISAVLVGMIFESKSSICLLDLRRRRCLFNTQFLVVVLVNHRLPLLYSFRMLSHGRCIIRQLVPAQGGAMHYSRDNRNAAHQQPYPVRSLHVPLLQQLHAVHG